MKRSLIIIAALLLASGGGYAETRIAQNGNDFVRLTTDVCTAQAVLEAIPEQFRHLVRDGTAYTAGREWHVCWFVDGDQAHLLYEDGDEGSIPMATFKKQRDA